LKTPKKTVAGVLNAVMFSRSGSDLRKSPRIARGHFPKPLSVITRGVQACTPTTAQLGAIRYCEAGLIAESPQRQYSKEEF
uniref:hypothetical protein n=1 Tax=Marinobacterium profundum TaxID=1714300 RepID=UPI001C1FD106